MLYLQTDRAVKREASSCVHIPSLCHRIKQISVNTERKGGTPMKKRALSLLLALVMCLSLVVPAMAETIQQASGKVSLNSEQM